MSRTKDIKYVMAETKDDFDANVERLRVNDKLLPLNSLITWLPAKRAYWNLGVLWDNQDIGRSECLKNPRSIPILIADGPLEKINRGDDYFGEEANEVVSSLYVQSLLGVTDFKFDTINENHEYHDTYTLHIDGIGSDDFTIIHDNTVKDIEKGKFVDSLGGCDITFKPKYEVLTLTELYSEELKVSSNLKTKKSVDYVSKVNKDVNNLKSTDNKFTDNENKFNPDDFGQ